MKIPLKPISVNQCWQGRRFKTPLYTKYEKDCLMILPKKDIGLPPYLISLEFGFSNKASDLDNPIKPTLDILQKKYGFNDSEVYELRISKKIVKKGQEYTLILIEQWKQH